MRTQFWAGSLTCFLIAVPVELLAWDPVKDITGKRADQHAKHLVKELSNAPASWARCVGDIGNCAEENIKRLPYAAAAPIVERYKQHLFNQGNGRWQVLPPYFIAAAQRHYPEVNLSGIRFATNINTLHGKHITWHNHIFFTKPIDLLTSDDIWLMLHELEHSVQYERRGGEQPFLSEYVLKSVGKVIQRGSFDVHDYIDLERAANSKADSVAPQLLSAIAATHAARPQRVSAVVAADGAVVKDVSNPLFKQRTLDACIKSPNFPESEGAQCSEPAQRLIADAFCRSAGSVSSVAWRTLDTRKFQSSYKYHATVAPGGITTSESWVPDDKGGAIFTSITCR